MEGGYAIYSTSKELNVFVDEGAVLFGDNTTMTIREMTTGGHLINYGTIDSMQSISFKLESSSTGEFIVSNYGTYNGAATSAGGALHFKNYNTWNIVDFDGRNNYGVRETQYVSMQNFRNGTIENYGSMIMRNPEFYGMEATSINKSGEYLVDGNAVHDLDNGAVQAAIYELNTFANSGVIDMTYNSHAGDVFVLTSDTTSGIAGGTSKYISNGGVLKIDTFLNEGGVNEASDVLVVDNTILGSGATTVLVNNKGGEAGPTFGDGIKVVEVLGQSSDVGSFKLGSVLASGIYEYTLNQGDLSGMDDLSWYLRANASTISPKIGGVLATQSAMNEIFMHGLYDRIGRPNFIDNCSEIYNKYGMWARVEGRNSSGDINSFAKFDTDIYMTQIGSDIYRTNLDKGSVHVGLMGSYGRIKTESKSKATGSKSDGTSDVYGVGAYVTYYNGPLYIDTWTQYSWASNKIGNKGNEKDKYDSSNITFSVETGYGLPFAQDEHYHYIFEPQVQVAYVVTNMDRYTSKVDQLEVSGKNDGYITRLGTRFYTKDKELRSYTLEPYTELNWYYSSNQISQTFNGEKYEVDVPKNRYEIKLGLQSAISQKFQIWGDFGYAFGKHKFDEKSITFGARYLW